MDYDAIAAEYARLRPISFKFNNAIVKTLIGDEITAAARSLGMFHANTIVADSEVEMAVLMDHAIYEIRREGMNAVERYARDSHAAEGSDERRLLDGMVRAEYGVISVTRVVRAVGVHVVEVFRDSERFLCDNGFSTTAVPGVMFASRLVPMGAWWKTSGAALPMTEEAGEIVRDLMKNLSGPLEESVLELAPELPTKMIRALLSNHAAESIRYDGPNSNRRLTGARPVAAREVTGRASTARIVGRNDPCPCGSGKKYKKCCGG